MKKIIGLNEFRESFENAGRGNQFTYEGLEALYNNLIEYEESCDCEIELDVIALCCEFTEYENLEELKNNYSDIESMEDLENKTLVIMIDDESFIIQDY